MKPFFDLDLKHGNVDTCAMLVIQAIRAALNMPELETFQSDASRDDKGSRHLTCQVVLPTLFAVW